MKYSAINIGPVVKTLGLARKPRELWSASFLFSDLMGYIINEVPKGVDIISPAFCPPCSGVGLYPDRLFIKGDISDAQMQKLINDAWEKFENDVFPGKDVRDYFSIMNASVEAEQEHEAVKQLNAILDRLELNVMASGTTSMNHVVKLIQMTSGSPLFSHGIGSYKMPVESLLEIAEASLEALNGDRKSFHDYVCVVQTDGDEVGSYVTSPSLKPGQLKDVSSALLDFGIQAKKAIDEFGGMPVYAGGDDLLFIAPVIGKDGKTTIFDLLANLDDVAFAGVRHHIPAASLSFGVSITYYRFPLYEALEMARKLLFGVAKNVTGKNAVAWTFQKHSGEQFSASFSRKHLWDEFMNLIDKTVDGNTVSAVAHKIREFGPLVSKVLESGARQRLDGFFDKVLEMKNNDYFSAVKELMPVLYDVCRDTYADVLYAILRTAKFVKGEEPKDE